MTTIRQRGDGKLGCVLWLLVLAAFVMIAVKVVPVKINSSQLYDFMEEQAKFAGNTKPDVLRRRILERAKELDLPVEQKNVKVQRRGGRVVMTCTYTVPIKFPGYTYRWKFQHLVDRPVFII